MRRRPPAFVDVAPRRLQAFRVRPGERVARAFGAQQGEAVAGADGSLRISGLALDLEWRTLELRRTPWPRHLSGGTGR